MTKQINTKGDAVKVPPKSYILEVKSVSVIVSLYAQFSVDVSDFLVDLDGGPRHKA